VSVGVSVPCGVGELDGACGQGERAAGHGRSLDIRAEEMMPESLSCMSNDMKTVLASQSL
jgi:hypothetical protein